jgi:hypothetical protein
MIGDEIAEVVEPEEGNLREYPAFAWYSRGQHMIEGRDSIGRDHEQEIPHRIEIADLTSGKQLQVFEFGSDERRQRFRLGREMTFRLSEVTTALSTQEKSTLFAPRPVHCILGIDCQVGGGC